MKNFTLASGVLMMSLLSSISFSQNQPLWDDPSEAGWPERCKTVAITSSLDGKIQPAIFMTSRGEGPRPLVVSLHTWSGGYDQKDTLVWQCLEKNYNYIHPDFRGRNNNPEACGSPAAIQDIDDAITYALNNSDADISRIHIIGVSGGGYSTLLAYMKSNHNVRSFSAWAPISDLYKWYYESLGRGQVYARDIANVTNGSKNPDPEKQSINRDEALKRSPCYMKTPVEKRRDCKLTIYTGIHDGYTGSVPVTQSLLFYNKVVSDFAGRGKKVLIPDQDIIELVSSRNFVNMPDKKIGSRRILYEKRYKDRVRLVIFEGSHEMLSEVALDHVDERNMPAE